MSDEDNSPLADEFTDLPLSHEEEPHTEQEQEPQWQEDSTPHAEVVAPSTSTQAYDPEAYITTAQHAFKDKGAVTIEIVDAGKSREGHSRGYIVYTIQCNGQIVRRRYSEFELLRNALLRLFPTLIIPPIPEKHKITKYAAAPTKAKEDSKIIDHRRRMLSVFLNRCLDIDSVRESTVFQDFLDPNSNWSEVLNSPPLSDIPKNILMADPMDPAHSSPAHSYLPSPSVSNVYVKETEEDKKFNQVESNAREYESVIAEGIQKTNKRLVKHFTELGTEFSEAGGVFNAFCLQESSQLAPTLEKLGQVHDNCYLSTEQTVKSFNHDFSEPLGESAQFATVVKDIIKFRQQKSLQLDLTARALQFRYNRLKVLLKGEANSKKIEEAIKVGEAKTGQINFDRKVAKEREQKQLQEELDDAANVDTTTPLKPKESSMFKIPGISKAISSIMKTEPTDPDAARESSLQKTKEEINQLKQTYNAAERDLERVTESVTAELQRFHSMKDEDLKQMMRAYAATVLDWSRKNLEFWEEAREQMA